MTDATVAADAVGLEMNEEHLQDHLDDDPTCSSCGSSMVTPEGQLVHEADCAWWNSPVGGGLGIIDASKTVVKDDDSPAPPQGYGELKVGMEGKLNGVLVVVRKITKKDIIMRPLNRSIRDKHGMMVSFKEGKK